MKKHVTLRRINLLFAGVLIFCTTFFVKLALLGYGSASAAPSKSRTVVNSPVKFTAKGEMIRPTGYRRWIYVGAPLTPNDMNNGKAAFPEFHSVYIDSVAFDRYEQTGEFPNGTVIVKELVGVGSKHAASGKGYFMGDFTGLEVAVKDKMRFRDEPGNWAYFSFGHKYPLKQKALSQATANCNTCHSTADEDFVFTDYYPVLRAARGTEKLSQ